MIPSIYLIKKGGNKPGESEFFFFFGPKEKKSSGVMGDGDAFYNLRFSFNFLP